MSNLRDLPAEAIVRFYTRDEARDFIEAAHGSTVFRVSLRNPVPFPGVEKVPADVQRVGDASFHVSRNQAIAAAKFFLTREMEEAGARVPVAEFSNRKGAPVYLVG